MTKQKAAGTPFDISGIGCYADCANGQKHRRTVLAGLIETNLPMSKDLRQLITELESDPPDDFSDEDDAIELLQSITEDGLVWLMVDGDLCLIEESELE